MGYDGLRETGHAGRRREPNSVYTPQPLGNRNFSFSNETLALMSDAEIAYTRLDEQSVSFPYSSALRKMLVNMEALATICVDGTAPNLETMFMLEAIDCAEKYGQGTGIAYRRVPSDKERAATLAAIRYSAVVQRIVGGPSTFEFDREVIIGLHRDLMYGQEEDKDAVIHFRQKPYQPNANFEGPVRNLYLAPDPAEIPGLIDDLMAFCNSPNLSPVTQAAVAHFYLEAARPFKTAMDRTGRAFCHMIMKKRSFYRHLVPPIALVPAMCVPNHAALLFPYRLNKPFGRRDEAIAIDRWTRHCAECLVLSAKLVRSLMRQLAELEEAWAARLPGVRKGSVVDMLLGELPGMPIGTVATAMAVTGKSFSAANDGVRQLVQAGILTPLNDDQRNRVFESREAMQLLQSIVGEAIPSDLVSRDSVIP